MRIGRIKQFIKHEPFRPFEFVLVSGDRVRARHPDFIYVIVDELLVGVDNGDIRIFGPEGVASIEIPRSKGRRSAS